MSTHVYNEIMDERKRQDDKWGEQNHDDYVFAAILGEEVGEVQQAMLKRDYEQGPATNIRKELIQLAAVAVGWLEAIDRRGRRKL